MSQSIVKVCDVYGVQKRVHTYRIRVDMLNGDGSLYDPPMINRQVDLGTRGRNQLLMAIIVALSQPGSKFEAKKYWTSPPP